MNKQFRYGIFIGRFQPLHLDHIEVMKKGLELAEHLIVFVGSSNQARTIKNPWTFQERKTMIDLALTEGLHHHLESRNWSILPLRDHYYNDDIWAMTVQQKIKQITNGCNDSDIVLLGSWKDDSSYYLKMFPQYSQHIARTKTGGLNATDIRNELFGNKITDFTNHDLQNCMSAVVLSWLKNHSELHPEIYDSLYREFEMIQKYKESWAKAPFPPTFITVDAVTICQGHVLVIKRKGHPGKGLYAIPGGFLEQEELIVDGAIRELKEETGIKIPKPALKNAIVDSKVFDYPGRSLRGRTITHAYCLRLNLIDGGLPDLAPGSDADSCLWMNFSDIHDNEDKFFEDHYSIIQYFISRPL